MNRCIARAASGTAAHRCEQMGYNGTACCEVSDRTSQRVYGRRPPSVETLADWVAAGTARAIDGCSVPSDGRCAHGYEAWTVAMGMVEEVR